MSQNTENYLPIQYSYFHFVCFYNCCWNRQRSLSVYTEVRVFRKKNEMNHFILYIRSTHPTHTSTSTQRKQFYKFPRYNPPFNTDLHERSYFVNFILSHVKEFPDSRQKFFGQPGQVRAHIWLDDRRVRQTQVAAPVQVQLTLPYRYQSGYELSEVLFFVLQPRKHCSVLNEQILNKLNATTTHLGGIVNPERVDVFLRFHNPDGTVSSGQRRLARFGGLLTHLLRRYRNLEATCDGIKANDRWTVDTHMKKNRRRFAYLRLFLSQNKRLSHLTAFGTNWIKQKENFTNSHSDTS